MHRKCMLLIKRGNDENIVIRSSNIYIIEMLVQLARIVVFYMIDPLRYK